ncbi:MAG: thioesterase family protein, partial [Lapillicoccus sp.]
PEDFPVRVSMETRWSDNDMFGHLNNAVYFELFDTAINGWLARQTATAPLEQTARGVVAETSCRYLQEVGFPETVVVGIAVERLGTKSVTYALGLFRDPADGASLAAVGRWVHVYVDPGTQATVAVPPAIRSALEAVTR